MKKTIIIGLLFLFFLLVANNVVVAGPLDLIFEPMRHIDIEEFYDDYHEMIDLIIYFIIFTGTSQAVFRKRFPGNPGKAMSVAIGIALSISLVIAEHYTGFSLKALGTIAATILILLLAAMIYYTLRIFGAGSVGAGTTALIITYLSIRTTTPQTYNWLQAQQIAPWTDLALIIALIIGFLKLLQTITTHKDTPILKLKERFTNQPQNPEPLPKSKQNAQELEGEKWFIKKKLKRNTKKGQKDEQKTTTKLQDIIKLLKTPRLSPKNRRQISKDLQEISEQESDLQKRLNQLKQTDQKLQDFDIQQFQNLKPQFDQFDKQGKRKLWQLVQAEREKIGTEQKIQKLQEKITQQDQLFKRYLNQAITLLNQNRKQQAAQWIRQAIRLEQESDSLWNSLKRLEDALLRITKKQLREIKR